VSLTPVSRVSNSSNVCGNELYSSKVLKRLRKRAVLLKSPQKVLNSFFSPLPEVLVLSSPHLGLEATTQTSPQGVGLLPPSMYISHVKKFTPKKKEMMGFRSPEK
jgi:hypothetical protein